MLKKIINKIIPRKTPTTAEGQKPKQNAINLSSGLISVKDIIAPSAIEVDFDWIKINNRYYRSFFVLIIRRFAEINWLSSLINFDYSLDISMYIYPSESKEILEDLRRKIAQMEAELSSDLQRGKVVNPATKAKLEDALSLQEELVKGMEKFFQFGLYITLGANSIEELNQITKELDSNLRGLLIIPKPFFQDMERGFKSTLPTCMDLVKVTRNMDTTSLATTFPFVSSDLSDDKGIMYGINEHNGSLVVFDRFSLENANSVVFAKSGAGKSYMVKLEALRSLMFDTEILVLDPENEYENLAKAVGGQYITFGFNSSSKINPFDLEISSLDEDENELRRKILSLHSLFKVIMGEMSSEEEAILDNALVQTYKIKGITPDPESYKNKEMPLIEDLYKILIGMEETKAASLAARLEKFIKGSFAGLFNSQTSVDINSKFVVFALRDLEEELRPIAMHIILDFIWNKIRKKLKKRILVVDEAWYIMKYPDSAKFLYSLVKRARKYYLGVTTITQDVDDFLTSQYGGAIIKNSSIHILLKQHPAAIDQLAEIFYLSEGEKQLLLGADIGEGIFFAGRNHVAIQVIASPEEHKLITSNPEELLRMKEAKIKENFLNKQTALSSQTTTQTKQESPMPAANQTKAKEELVNSTNPKTPAPAQALNQAANTINPVPSLTNTKSGVSKDIFVNQNNKAQANHSTGKVKTSNQKTSLESPFTQKK